MQVSHEFVSTAYLYGNLYTIKGWNENEIIYLFSLKNLMTDIPIKEKLVKSLLILDIACIRGRI